MAHDMSSIPIEPYEIDYIVYDTKIEEVPYIERLTITTMQKI